MLDIDLAVSIKRLSVAFVPLMLGIILHEVAHGWAALKRGDPTAAMLGRLTLNPVPHIDPMGLFVFVLTSLTGPFVFGWAKPVPINPRNSRPLTAAKSSGASCRRSSDSSTCSLSATVFWCSSCCS